MRPLSALPLALAAGLAPAGAAADFGPCAVAAFAGVTLDNGGEHTFIQPWEPAFTDSRLVGVARSARVAEPIPGLSLEIEGQMARHFGDRDHRAVNAPIAGARWSRFAWAEALRSSAAFGLGLSTASETPAQEVANEGDSRQAPAYRGIEGEAGAPESPWRLIGRLHRRSTA